MKCMNEKGLRAYQVRWNLKNLKNPWGRGFEWKGECLGKEQSWTDRERSKKWEENQEQKLDRSSKCRGAIEEAGAFSIDPPGIEELSGLR